MVIFLDPLDNGLKIKGTKFLLHVHVRFKVILTFDIKISEPIFQQVTG